MRFIVLALGLLLLSSCSLLGLVRLGGRQPPAPPAAPVTRSVDALLEKYTADLAADGYASMVFEARHAAHDTPVPLTAVKGECYQLVLLAEKDGYSAGERDGAWATWGPLRDDYSQGRPQYGSGDSLIDLGCLMAGSAARWDVKLALHANDESTHAVRVYKKSIGVAKAEELWAEKLGKVRRANENFAVVANQCQRIQSRFDACVKGKRPTDYATGVSCRQAALMDRAKSHLESCSLD